MQVGAVAVITPPDEPRRWAPEFGYEYVHGDPPPGPRSFCLNAA